MVEQGFHKAKVAGSIPAIGTLMKIFVKVKPSSKKEFVDVVDESHFIIAIKEPPREGKANVAIAEALAAHFHIPFSHIRLVSGFSSREKIFEIV